jgi:hypothetical protein
LHLGYRRVEVVGGSAPEIYDLCTAEAQTAEAQILAMQSVVERDLPRTKGPFWYLTPTGAPRRLFSPHRVLTFIRDHLDAVLDTVALIAEAPASIRRAVLRTVPNGQRIAVGATQALLTEKSWLLNPSEIQVVSVAGQPYAPAMVVTRELEDTLDTIEHRNLAGFLSRIWSDCAAIEDGSNLTHEDRVFAGVSRRRCAVALSGSFLDDLVEDAPDGMPSGEVTELEQSDWRYRDLARFHADYLSEGSPGAAGRPYRLHVADADEIYQAFCARVVAEAFGLDPVGPDLSVSDVATKATFVGRDFELIYNRVGAIPSWRDDTDHPDKYRPDLLLRERRFPHRVALLDAKYSVETGRVPGGRLKEVQAYMQSYRIPMAGVLFPGSSSQGNPSWFDLAGQGNLLREIPLVAVPAADLDRLLDNLRSGITGLLCAGVGPE